MDRWLPRDPPPGNAVALPAPARRPGVWLFPLGALLLGLAVYGYITAIIVPQQVDYGRTHNVPRGNLSDLYPRWYGTYERLWHGRDPYSAAVTQEIQVGYYGRLLTPADTVKDQQGFAYPLYVVFLLAPLTLLPFSLVQPLFGLLLLILTALAVLLWLGALRWRLPAPAAAAACLLVVGSWPALQAWSLEQLTALVAALLAAAAYCLTRGAGPPTGERETPPGGATGWYVAAGALLAVATIKPQITVLLVAGLVLWAGGAWRARQAAAWGFLGTLALLVGGALLLQPTWIGDFRAALSAYAQYTHGESLLLSFARAGLGGVAPGLAEPLTDLGTAVLSVVALIVWWRGRQAPAGSFVFARALALTLAVTLLIIPTWAPYNQLILVPAALLLARHWPALQATGRRWVRWLWMVAAVMLTWPAVLSVVLMIWLALTLAGGAGCCAAPIYQPGASVLPVITSLFAPWAVLAALAGLWTIDGRPQTADDR